MAVNLLLFRVLYVLLVWSGLMSCTFPTSLVSHFVSVLGSGSGRGVCLSEVGEDLDELKKLDSGVTDLRTCWKVLSDISSRLSISKFLWVSAFSLLLIVRFGPFCHFGIFGPNGSGRVVLCLSHTTGSGPVGVLPAWRGLQL